MSARDYKGTATWRALTGCLIHINSFPCDTLLPLLGKLPRCRMMGKATGPSLCVHSWWDSVTFVNLSTLPVPARKSAEPGASSLSEKSCCSTTSCGLRFESHIRPKSGVWLWWVLGKISSTRHYFGGQLNARIIVSHWSDLNLLLFVGKLEELRRRGKAQYAITRLLFHEYQTS